MQPAIRKAIAIRDLAPTRATRALSGYVLAIALSLGPLPGSPYNAADAKPDAQRGAKNGRSTSDRSKSALLKAGDMALAGGDTASAAEFYRRAGAIAPTDPVPYDHLGDALYKAHAYGGAFDAYLGGLSHGADSFEANRKLGRLALILGKPERAIVYFEAARGKRGDDPQIWNGLGIAHDSLGDHVQAQSDYRAAMKLTPDNLAIRNNFGLSQALAGDYPGAVATLSAVVLDPRATARSRQNLALAYGLAGDGKRASIASRADIGEADSANNQQYYALLRAMDDRARTRAILGSEFGAGASGTDDDPIAAIIAGQAAKPR